MEEKKDRACPCLYLDVACDPRCTCLSIISSVGCANCCTYGGLEQRKQMAEHLNKVRIKGIETLQKERDERDTRDND